MLKGFTVPKSLFDQAALTPPPPRHYAGDAVGVEFRTDADATAATLPNGHAVMMFLDWQFSAQDGEYLEPVRYHYREASILVDAMYRDVPVVWCPYTSVDNDAALARGWAQGFPKKMGGIFRTSLRSTNWRCRSPTNTVAGAWIGNGELNFPANGEEFDALAPNRIECGFRCSLSYSVSDLKILEDHGS